MDAQIIPASEAEGHRPPVTSHESPVTSSKLFSFTHFRKNGSATPLVSHTFKTKDLKPFRFTHLQKKGGGTPCFPLDACVASSASSTSFTSSISFPCVQPPTFDLQPPLFSTVLHSAAQRRASNRSKMHFPALQGDHRHGNRRTCF